MTMNNPGTQNTTSGSAMRHTITGVVGILVTQAAQSYLGLPVEVAGALGTAVSGAFGAIFRSFIK